MTRRDYIAIAEALRSQRPSPTRLPMKDMTKEEKIMYDAETVSWGNCVLALARVCGQHAGRGGFDRDRFLAACGMGEADL